MGNDVNSINGAVDVLGLTNQVYVDIVEVDADGFPTSTVIGSSNRIDISDVNRETFYQFTFDTPVQTVEGRAYAAVLKRTGRLSDAGWVFTQDDAYSDGERFVGDTWTAYSDQDHFFKVYYAAATTTTVTENTIQFNQNHADRWFVSTDNTMELDMRFMISFCIDGTGSMAVVDPVNIRRSEAYLFAREVMRRASYSFIDVWTFDDTIQEYTATGPTDTRQLYAAALGSITSTGKVSRLWAAAERAVGNLEPALAVEAIVRDEDVDDVLELMRQMNRIDYEDLVNIDPNYDPSLGFSVIENYGKIVDYLIQEYADTMGRAAIIISDGFDTVGDGDPDDIATLADAVAGDDKTPVHCFSMGANHWSEDMLSVSEGTGGIMCQVGENRDRLREALNYLLNDSDNTIFQGAYEETVEFDELTFIESIELGAIIPLTSSLTFQISVTYDGLTYQEWETIPTNTRHILKRFIHGFKYKLRGWLGNIYGGNYYDIYGFDVATEIGDMDTVGCRYLRYYGSDTYSYVYATSAYYYYRDADYPSPRVYSLRYWTVTPATTYNFTELQSGGPISEYVLSSTSDLPDTAILNWGIVRGDSTDFADAEEAVPNRRGILPNRIAEVYFTPDVTLVGLQAVKQDQNGVLFKVFNDDGTTASWTDTDEVSVYANGAELDVVLIPYQLSGDTGYILFKDARPTGDIITVDILTPGAAAAREGEICYSTNYRTYTAKNGAWPWDAEVTVRVNGAIKRDGYLLTPSEGTVFFLNELNPADEVSVEIDHSTGYRIAYKMQSYDDDDPADDPDFGLMYTKTSETDTLFFSGQTLPPVASNVTLLPTNRSLDLSNPDLIIEISTTDRLVVSYDFSQDDGNSESGTGIEWYVKRERENEFSRYADYSGRNVMRKSEVTANNPSGPFQEGDRWYVVVTPSDTNNDGDPVQSNTVSIGDSQPPYISAATIIANDGDDDLITDDNGEIVAQEQDLVASYTYLDPNLTGDQSESDTSAVEWYRNGQMSASYTGDPGDKVLPASEVTAGDVWYYVITPYDGINYGSPIQSDDVTITREKEATG